MNEQPPGSPLALGPLQDGVAFAHMMRGRVGQIFGGQLAAHSMTAAARVAPTLGPHSLHLIFLAVGDADRPVAFHTAPVKLGKAMSVIRVDVEQDERLLASSLVTCQADEQSQEHGIVAPSVPRPSECPQLDLSDAGGVSPVWSTVEARHVLRDNGQIPCMRLWLRWTAELPDEASAHAAALVWITDLAMLRTARLPSASDSVWARPGASLDHSVWLHRAARADEWLLLDVVSPVRAGARALAEARLFNEAGQLVASSAQECITR